MKSESHCILEHKETGTRYKVVGTLQLFMDAAEAAGHRAVFSTEPEAWAVRRVDLTAGDLMEEDVLEALLAERKRERKHGQAEDAQAGA